MGEKRAEQIGRIEKGADQREADPITQTKAAQIFVQVKEPARALRYADRAVVLAPDNPEARAVRAVANYDLGDYAAAKKDAAIALEADANNASAQAVMKLIAERNLSAALKNPPPDFGASGGSGTSLNQNPPVQNISQASVARYAIDPDSLEAAAKHLKANGYLSESSRSMNQGEFKDAFRYAAKAIETDPGYSPAYLQAGLAELSLGQPSRAVEAISRSLGLGLPGQFAPVAFNALSTAYFQTGDFDKALTAGEWAVGKDPRGARGYLNRAKAEEGLRYPDEKVLTDYRQASVLAVAEPLKREFMMEYQMALARYGKSLEARPGSKTAPSGFFGRGRLAARLWIIGAILGLFGVCSLSYSWFLNSRPAKSKKNLNSKRNEEGAVKPLGPDSPYEVGRVVGHGGMGMVYEGQDKHLRRKVAIKELRPELQKDLQARERFLREARTVAQISHPNVVAIHSVINDPERTLLVFEYIQGRTLSDIIEKTPQHRLPIKIVLSIARQVCAALDYAHAKHVIHRDLKPSNIMVEDSGRVKVMDFGIARQAKDSLMAVTNTVMGTPFYMAPEMEEGVVGKESDLYSFAVCLYEMLSGELPFEGAGCQRLKKEAQFKPITAVNPALPTRLNAFFNKTFSPFPDDRYRNAKDFYKGFELAAS